MDDIDLELLARNLDDGNVEDIYTAIHTLGNAGYVAAKPEVEKFLANDDPEIRYIALNVLTIHWGCKDHRQTCERLVEGDPDSQVRRIAVAGLGALLEGTRDQDALRLLLKLFSNEGEEPLIRETAYSQILFVLGKSPKDQPSAAKALDFEKDVNWDWIKEAKAAAGISDIAP